MLDTCIKEKYLTQGNTMNLETLLFEWPLSIIRDVDIASAFPESSSRRYAMVNRALKKRMLVALRRGVYLIGKPLKKGFPSSFQVAHSLYGPGYISFESALHYHQWIPEAVYATTCATAKRANTFTNPLGVFNYVRVPNFLCYLGVQRVEDDEESFLIADPWKAIADHFYIYNRNWQTPEDLYLDMRIEMEDMLESDLSSLKLLSEHYQNSRVRNFLAKILDGLNNGNKNYRR